MRSAIFACLAMACMMGTARADACSNLAATANAALGMKGIDAETKSQIEQLLKEAQSGDPARCEQATGSIFQSSPEGEKAPRLPQMCKDQQNAV